MAVAGYLTGGFVNLLFPVFREHNKSVLEGFLGSADVIGELALALYLVIARVKIAKNMKLTIDNQ